MGCSPPILQASCSSPSPPPHSARLGPRDDERVRGSGGQLASFEDLDQWGRRRSRPIDVEIARSRPERARYSPSFSQESLRTHAPAVGGLVDHHVGCEVYPPARVARQLVSVVTMLPDIVELGGFVSRSALTLIVDRIAKRLPHEDRQTRSRAGLVELVPRTLLSHVMLSPPRAIPHSRPLSAAGSTTRRVCDA